MPSLRFQVLGGVLIGLLVVIVGFSLLLGRTHQSPAPPSEPRAAATVAPEPPAPAPVTAPSGAPTGTAPTVAPSRSRGQSDWAFFFRAGDTLSRMSDGAALGVIVRLERSHVFPDGTGPAYVVRSADQRETVFDADQLERSARVDTIREIARPPIAPRTR
jgi:hypothetical protein